MNTINWKKVATKSLALLSTLTALTAATSPANEARAEGKVGNGGGTWVCQNNDSIGTLRWAKLVDLYEGRAEFGMDIPDVNNRDYLEIVDKVMIRRVFPISQDLYRSINEELESVRSSIVLVDADLEIVDDSLFRIRPPKKECQNGQINYVQLANYTNYGKVLIQKGLFEDARMGETDKAALMIHEAVYAYLRKQFKDKDSVRARKIVGLLFSTMPQDVLKKEIETVLGGGLNAIGMEFVRVRAGTFMMGSSNYEPNRDRDEELHLVQLSRDFEIQTTDITQKQYFDVMGFNPSRFKNIQNCPRTYQATPNGFVGCPNNPVETVTWRDAQAFIARLNQTQRDGYNYRLPTEAEFEFAARAGTRGAYSFGNDPSQLALYGWFSGNSAYQTHEVALLRPNNLGLYDMHGNVWKWVQDTEVAYDGKPLTDPVGTGGYKRVVRGGSWFSSGELLRSANRNYFAPDERINSVGFRLVRTK